MAYKYFAHNNAVRPVSQAQVPLDSVEYSYGFGVYESIRVDKSRTLFLEEHLQRLNNSAAIIGLEHGFNSASIQKSIGELIDKNQIDNCNLKILLIGGQSEKDANLYILCLNPLYPERKLYKSGAHVITRRYERPFPNAKTLSMLPSYLAYRDAKKAAAYDALAVNSEGFVTEGTRTNFFTITSRTIFSPPSKDILPGVTRDHVLKIARKNNFKIEEANIPLAEISKYDGAFLTSTSSKIMPLKSIDDYSWEAVHEPIKELIQAFEEFQKLQST